MKRTKKDGHKPAHSRLILGIILNGLLLKGVKIDILPQFGTFKQAQKVRQSEGLQEELF